jgi:hypothetical protein
MAMIHISRSGGTLGVFDEARVREGLKSGEFIETDLGWTEGMSTWRPLSEFDTFAVQASAAAAAPSPGGAAAAATEPAHTVAPGSEVIPSGASAGAAATGLPWENRETLGFVSALLGTIGMVLTRPSEAFTVMRKQGNFVDPLLYTVILSTIGGAVSWVFSTITTSMGLTSSDAALGMMMGAGMGVFFLIMIPFLVVISSFIIAGLFHVGLMLFGGAKQPFETTFRVVAFGGGSANVFQLVPVCGGVIAGIYSIVLYCIGLSRAHEMDTMRAVGAVLLPVVVCCGAVFFFMMLAGIGAAAFSR